MPTHFAMAVHVLAYLDLQEGRIVKSDELAASVGTSGSQIRKLMMALNEAHLTVSVVGRSGGAKLALASTEMTLLDVYRAVGASGHALMPPSGKSFGPLARKILTALQRRTDLAERDFETELGRTTIFDLTSGLDVLSNA